MGRIKQLFFRENTLDQRLMSQGLWVDICENIHLHFRDLRIEFAEAEFLQFLSHIEKIKELFITWRKENPDWQEAESPEHFDNRFVKWLKGYEPSKKNVEPKSIY